MGLSYAALVQPGLVKPIRDCGNFSYVGVLDFTYYNCCTALLLEAAQGVDLSRAPSYRVTSKQAAMYVAVDVVQLAPTLVTSVT